MRRMSDMRKRYKNRENTVCIEHVHVKGIKGTGGRGRSQDGAQHCTPYHNRPKGFGVGRDSLPVQEVESLRTLLLQQGSVIGSIAKEAVNKDVAGIRAALGTSFATVVSCLTVVSLRLTEF